MASSAAWENREVVAYGAAVTSAPTDTASGHSEPPVGGTFRSFREPNVRMYMASFAVSGVGTWAQTTALILFVRELGGDGFELGLITAFQFLPLLLLGLFAGSVADRVDRYRLTMGLQAAMTAQSLLLGILVLGGLESLPALYGLTFMAGTLAAFDNPTRRTFVTELARPEDLANVTSLATSVMTGSRMIGPLIAAAMFAAVGAGWVFILNGISFAVMFVGLSRLDRSRFRLIQRSTRSAHPIRDGLRTVWADPVLRIIMVIFAVVSTFGFNTLVALPLVVDELLGRDDTFFGYLLSALSLGNVIGSLLVARQVNVSPRWVLAAGALLGTTLIIGGASTNVFLTFGAVAILGLASTSFVNSTTVILQQRSSEQMRSRVLALSAVLFLGSTPIGGPITGLVADQFGAAWSMLYGGLITVACVIIGALALRSLISRSALQLKGTS